MPYDPLSVLSQLHTTVKTPTPPQSSHGSHSSQYTPETPHTIRQLGRQAHVIKRYLRHRTISPLSPTHQALDQLVKGCEMAMHNAVLLANENVALRAANQKQRQKRAKKAISISQGGVLTVQEGQRRTTAIQNEAITIEERTASQGRTRAPKKCSLCSSYEHTARTCAQRYSTS